MKKALKVIGIIILVLVVIVVAAPFLFKDTIEKQVKKAINENIEATVEWRDLSLSLISSFPDARLKLEGVSVINKAPFKGDTLASAETLFLDMGIPQLFKGDNEALHINELGLENALINLKVNKQGVANYDIAKETPEAEQPTDTSGGLTFDVQHYEIVDSRVNYLDESSNMFLRLSHLNHEGTGDFSAQTSTLHTTTKALVSFAMDSTNYLDKTSVKLDADIKMDFENMKFSFEENKALVNQLPLTFDGYVQVNADNQELDITFKTPSSDFKNFLGVMPKEYAKNLDAVKTTGDFTVNGRLYGVVDDKHIPKIKITVKSNNASFKYPDLPKAVKDITIDALLVNKTGLMKDMNLNLNKLTFRIDQDVFAANGTFKDLTGNMLVDLNAKGTLNLANLDKAYPLDTDMDLNGILQVDLRTSFAMSAIENEHYDQIKSYGAARINDFKYVSDEFAHPIAVSKAEVTFDPGNVVLKEFDMTTGQTDVHLSGKLQNLMGYLFKDQPIKGRFDLTSHVFSVNDFMMTTEEEKSAAETANTEKSEAETAEEAIKVPSFLDVVLNFKADKVLYDNLSLTNAKGILIIRDETATLKAITADIFGGTIGLDGSVATKTKTPKFNMDLSLKKIDIIKSVQEMGLLKNLAPIAKTLVGELSTNITLNGNLTQSLLPIYSSIAGNGMAVVLNAKIKDNQMPLVTALARQVDFINFDKLQLKDLTTYFTFENGGLKIKPFTFEIYNGIKAKISGRHGFDNQMDYQMNLSVPAKYLGKEVSKRLAKLTSTDLKNTMVTVPVEFLGSLTQPKVKVDVESAANTLTSRIVQAQKEQLKNKAEDKLSDLLSGIGNKNGNPSDSTKVEKPKDSATTSEKETIKNAAENLLDGLFGQKSKTEKKKQKQE